MRLAAVPLSALRASPHSDLPGQTCPCGRAGSDGPALACYPFMAACRPCPHLSLMTWVHTGRAGHISQGFLPVDQEVGGSFRF